MSVQPGDRLYAWVLTDSRSQPAEVMVQWQAGLHWRAAYWGKNLRQTVRFAGAVESALRDGYRFFLEIGAHPLLTGHLEQCLAARGVEGMAAPSLRRPSNDTLRAKKGAGPGD